VSRESSGDGVTTLVILLPSGSNCLVLGEETNSGLAVEVGVTGEGLLVSGETEHGEGYGNGEIDTDLSGLDLILKFTSSSTTLGKYSSTISIWVLINKLYSLI